MASNLTLTGTPSFVAGGTGFGTCVDFGAGKVTLAAPASGTPMIFAGQPFSVRLRVKTTSTAAWACLATHINGSTPVWGIGFTTGGLPYAQANGINSNSNLQAAAGAINDGAWHTLCLVVNETGASLYVDGAVPSGCSGTGTYANVTGGTDYQCLGDYYPGSSQAPFTGQIDEVAIYSRALSAIDTAPAAPTANGDTGLVALWHLDSTNASGSTVLDCKGVSIAVDPTSGAAGTSLSFTGTGTQWSTVAPAFTLSGAGNSITGQSVSSNTAASGTTAGTTNGAQTITDLSSGATASFTVSGDGPTPGTLSVTGHTSSSVSLSLATNSGGTAPYSNQLYRSPTGAGSWSTIGAPATGTTATWTDSTAAAGTTYDYKVTVTDDASLTADSNTVTQATDAAPSLTITGPSYATVGTASSNYTVTLSETPATSLTVSLDDGSAGGTFTPSSLTVTNPATTATFTYTGESTGSKTLTASGTGYTDGTRAVEILSTTTSILPAVAAYGVPYTGLAAAIGYTVYATDGTELIARTTGETHELGSTGYYVAGVPIESSWAGVVLFDAPAGTVPAAVPFQGGVMLAANGLDTIPTTAPSGVAGTFREMVVSVWRSVFKKVARDNTAKTLTYYADDGTTVLATQDYTDDGAGNQTRGAAS